MNTSEFLNISNLIVPDRIAIIFEGQKTSYSDLFNRVIILANSLKSIGLTSGDRIAVMQVNCPAHIELYFASALLDLVYVPLNFRSTKEELSHMLEDSSPRVIFSGERYVSMIDSLKPTLGFLDHFYILDGDNDDWIRYESLISESELTISGDFIELPEITPYSEDDDLTMLMFTSGTTGFPKGVMLTHESFSSYILSNVMPADIEVEEKNILTVPLYHIAGVQAFMAAIYGGRTLIIQKQFRPDEWMELVQKEKVNRAMMVPTMLKMIIDHPDFMSYDMSTLEVITYGAAPMPLSVIRKAIEVLPNAHFINAFGQTETAATITMLPPEDHILKGSPDEIEIKLNRLTSIGKPLPDVEVKIVDADNLEVNIGDIGEIITKGDRLMKGYWNQKESTEQAIRNGWLYTGDLGYIDSDGYIFLAGRVKDFIKRGGEMISPEEVERVLDSHPSIDESAIIGVPDLDWGERVRAIVAIKDGESFSEYEIIEYCRTKLSSFKKPESVVVVDKLPRNLLGKVLKNDLRDVYSYPIS
ncbi:MAG: class I adenylate-forming enzyme family protein [Dehalococcoidia bacterium]